MSCVCSHISAPYRIILSPKVRKTLFFSAIIILLPILWQTPPVQPPYQTISGLLPIVMLLGFWELLCCSVSKFHFQTTNSNCAIKETYFGATTPNGNHDKPEKSTLFRDRSHGFWGEEQLLLGNNHFRGVPGIISTDRHRLNYNTNHSYLRERKRDAFTETQ